MHRHGPSAHGPHASALSRSCFASLWFSALQCNLPCSALTALSLTALTALHSACRDCARASSSVAEACAGQKCFLSPFLRQSWFLCSDCRGSQPESTQECTNRAQLRHVPLAWCTWHQWAPLLRGAHTVRSASTLRLSCTSA